MGSKILSILVLGLMMSSAALISMAENAAPVAEAPAVAAPTEQPAMTEEEKAKQAMMQEYMTVNEHHEFLKSLAGNWTAKVKFWMDPAGQPEESEGSSEAKIIMGGRFLEQNYNGTIMGQPFEGRGILGYDNLKKEYTSIWFDNMATGIMTGSGQYNPESKILLAEGTMSCPMTQETKRWYRDVTTFTDADHYTYETYMKDKNGVEYKSMIITYSRAQ